MGNDKDTWVAGMLIQIIYSKTKQNYNRNITRRCIIQFRVKKHTCSLKGDKDVDAFSTSQHCDNRTGRSVTK